MLKTRCWLWTGATDPKGYGQCWDPAYQRAVKAHRIAWILTYGPIQPRVNVLHRCDIALCVNADEHLFLGTLADNNADMLQKGRARGPAVLTTADVRLIRAEYAAGVSQAALGRRFAVSQVTIQAVTARRTWKHVV